MDFEHNPVLLREVIENLNIKPDGIYVDCTVGGGGHAYEIAKKLGPEAVLIGIDRDPEAIEEARRRLSGFQFSLNLIRSNFSQLRDIVGGLSLSRVDGFLADLGVSSYQLDKPERGFSYMEEAPLDMRMDPDLKVTAADIVNNYSVKDLEEIIFRYGEERWAKRIASFIVDRREKKYILTTGELVDLIKAAIPLGARKSGPHPAKRTFQALRIEVNNELNVIKRLVEDMVELASPGARLCVISFHSLEDRIVKNSFKNFAKGCICPPGLPECTCGNVPKLKLITKKPVVPEMEEKETNPRARSAKLRVAEKLVLNTGEVE